MFGGGGGGGGGGGAEEVAMQMWTLRGLAASLIIASV